MILRRRPGRWVSIESNSVGLLGFNEMLRKLSGSFKRERVDITIFRENGILSITLTVNSNVHRVLSGFTKHMRRRRKHE